ncbi:sirohydrochlorin chelatase [Ruegeria marina]|nr:CbiX/SirB N-terminal domain-containing protein [Ruegeria marina]
MTELKHALIVAHGQPSEPEPAEAALAALAARVNANASHIAIRSATLASPGRLEEILDDLPDGTPVYPLFTAKGWFVTRALPRRIGGRACPVMEPLGIDPELPDAVAEYLTSELAARQWEATATELVLAAHGSGRSQNPAEVAHGFADELQSRIGFARLTVGFVEQPPSIAEAAQGCGEQSLCLPFFACAGGHVQDDVPQALAEARFPGDTLPVLGDLPAVTRLIARRISEFSDAAT